MTYSLLYGDLVTKSQPFIQTQNGYYVTLTNWLRYNGWGAISLLSGSFNPLHDGHIEVLNHLRHDNLRTFAEISIKHVTKPHVTREDLYDRLLPFVGKFPVLITDQPLIVNKLGLLKDAGIFKVTMGMGVDVANKFVEMHGKLFVSALNACFQVYERDLCKVNFNLPHNMVICDLPENKYRDLSSTQIRLLKENKGCL